MWTGRRRSRMPVAGGQQDNPGAAKKAGRCLWNLRAHASCAHSCRKNKPGGSRLTRGCWCSECEAPRISRQIASHVAAACVFLSGHMPSTSAGTDTCKAQSWAKALRRHHASKSAKHVASNTTCHWTCGCIGFSHTRLATRARLGLAARRGSFARDTHGGRLGVAGVHGVYEQVPLGKGPGATGAFTRSPERVRV